jgi:hypothetical protein
MILRYKAHHHLDVIALESPRIERLERHLGPLNIGLCLIKDELCWIVWPTDESKVIVMDGYNWGPGAGPRRTLTECIDGLIFCLDRCRAIIVGKPGEHGVHVPRPENILIGARFL